MNYIQKMLNELLNLHRVSINCRGLINLLSYRSSNEEVASSLQAEEIYNKLIEGLKLDLPKDINYQSNIYGYFGIQTTPNDTNMVAIVLQVLHIKRFDSELFIFTELGWQKLKEMELKGLIEKVINVLLIDHTPSQNKLKNIVNGVKESYEVETLIEKSRYIGCQSYMFDLETFQVVSNDINIFPKTRLDLDLNKRDAVHSQVPSNFDKYISELANHDKKLRQFLIQHMAVLLTGDTQRRKGLILYGKANNGKSIFIKLLKSFFYTNDVVSKTLNELVGRFDKQSLIGKRLMASDEIGQAKITETVVNDFKKLLSMESIHIDRKSQTQIETKLDLKMIFNTNAILNFPNEHANALERRIAIVPCDYYVHHPDPNLFEALVQEKKALFLYLMHCYQEMVNNGIVKIENDRVTDLTHDWLNFGYHFIDSAKVSITHQKRCIKLIRGMVKKEAGAKIYAPELNQYIQQEISISKQVIKQLIRKNIGVEVKLINGYDYWDQLDWQDNRQSVNTFLKQQKHQPPLSFAAFNETFDDTSLSWSEEVYDDEF